MSKTRAAKEEWPFCNEHERDRIGRLIDRTQFLRDRIARNGSGTVAYDKAELSALEWVLEVVKEHYEHVQNCCDYETPAEYREGDIDKFFGCMAKK